MLLSYQNQQCDLKDIDAAIFDLDGTLVESEPVWAEAKQYIANRENVDVSEHILLAYVGRSVADFVAEVILSSSLSFQHGKKVGIDLSDISRAFDKVEDGRRVGE